MSKQSIADLAYNILEENHYPMHYRKITEEIMKIKEIKAEHPHHDVNALMGVDQRFVRYKRGIWGLLKWKYREANLPYTLTSYCLRNGTIYLTTYLKPYFSLSRDDRPVEVTFIDSDGEEIKAIVDYRQKLISGFKEWYQKKGLEVNDTILIGLIEETKRTYFLIAEKDIKFNTEQDMGDSIYQILQEEGKPLSCLQIYTRVIKKEPAHQGLFEGYIQNILSNDNRFVEMQKNLWGLFEWLDETEQLYLNLFTADNFNDFQQSLKKCFEFLGYDTQWCTDFPNKLFLAKAALDYKSYSLIVTGLPKNYNINMVHSLDWSGMRKAKEMINADSIILFLEKFYLKELIDRASEEAVQLYELSILDYLIKEHQQVPFSLFDLRIAFNPMHHPRNNLEKLQEIRENQWSKWKLMKRMLHILQESRLKNTFMDINLLVKQLNTIGKPFDDEAIEQMEVKEIIDQLNKEPFKLIELSESGNIILPYSEHIALQKMQHILQFIMNSSEV